MGGHTYLRLFPFILSGLQISLKELAEGAHGRMGSKAQSLERFDTNHRQVRGRGGTGHVGWSISETTAIQAVSMVVTHDDRIPGASRLSLTALSLMERLIRVVEALTSWLAAQCIPHRQVSLNLFLWRDRTRWCKVTNEQPRRLAGHAWRLVIRHDEQGGAVGNTPVLGRCTARSCTERFLHPIFPLISHCL
jgi:hypothetical protein